ncbi:MAG: hypothetical protein KF878_19190 [Planctomycetes bacterium]|nr:hypothetical protein [Planctomycetota bacterium]
MVLRSALATLALALPVAAADPPRLREVQVNGEPIDEVSRGGVVALVGSHLHTCPGRGCRHPGLRVTVDGWDDVRVLEGTGEQLVVIIPAATRLGWCEVRVEVDGRASPALDVEVVDPPPEGRGVPGPRDQVRHALRVERFEAVLDGSLVRFLVEGARGPLLAGAWVEVILFVGGWPIEARSVRLEGDGLSAVFGPYEARTRLAGTWAVGIRFELARQPAPFVLDLRRALDASDPGALERVERRGHMRLGTDEELRLQEEAIVRHYRAQEEALRGIHSAIAWTRVAGWGDRRRQARPDPGVLLRRFVEVAEANLLPAFAALLRDEDGFAATWTAHPCPPARRAVHHLLSHLAGSFVELAEHLHRQARLDVPDSLRSVPGVESGEPAATSVDDEWRVLREAARNGQGS